MRADGVGDVRSLGRAGAAEILFLSSFQPSSDGAAPPLSTTTRTPKPWQYPAPRRQPFSASLGVLRPCNLSLSARQNSFACERRMQACGS